MLEYRDPNNDDDSAARWDEYIAEFGVEAYVEMRYMDGAALAPGDEEAITEAEEALANDETQPFYSWTVPCPRCGEVHPV